MDGASNMMGPWLRIHRGSPSKPALRHIGTKFPRFPLRSMSCVALVQVLRRAKAALFICFAIGLLLAGAHLANATGHDHPPGTELPHSTTQASEMDDADPCAISGHHVAHCCSALHCMAGFATAQATLPSPTLKSPVRIETAGLPGSRTPDRLDRPPKPQTDSCHEPVPRRDLGAARHCSSIQETNHDQD